MLERMQGTVEAVDDGSFVLRTGDFSLRLLASRNLTSKLSPGRVEDLAVQLVIQLEGNRLIPICIAFADEIERDVFEALVSVSGVGARAAVKALARPAGEIASAVVSGDERFLATLPGIGKARARQIIAALQDRLSRGYSPTSPGIEGDAWTEARLVLSQIGIPAPDADQLLSKARTALSGNDSPASSEIVREAMRARSQR